MATVLGFVFCIFVSIVMPVVLSIYLCVTKRLSWKHMLAGAAVFGVMQVLFRMQILNMLNRLAWFEGITGSLWAYAFFLAVTAALVEEWGRFLGNKVFLGGQASYRNAVAFGIGHGFMESFSLLSVASINNLLIAVQLNGGQFESLAESIGLEPATQIRDLMVSTPAVEIFAGGVERLMAVVIHVALTLLVYWAIRQRRVAFVWVAVAAHTLLNLPLMPLASVNVWLAEGFIVLTAVLATVVISKMRRRFAECGEE